LTSSFALLRNTTLKFGLHEIEHISKYENKELFKLFQAQGPNIQARHCVLGLSPDDGIVTITPTSAESETYVNNQRVFETTTLQNGMTVRLGKLNYFRFIDPNYEEVSSIYDTVNSVLKSKVLNSY